MSFPIGSGGLAAFRSARAHFLAESWGETGVEPAPSRLAAAGISLSATKVVTTDALLFGSKWTGTITYSFPDSAGDYGPSHPEASNGFLPISFAQMQATRYILDGSSAFSGGPRTTLMPVEGFTLATFVDRGFNGADIRIARSYSAGDTAYAYMPDSHEDGGDIWFGRVYDYSEPEVGAYEFMTLAHELGHALGLKHSHETGGVDDVALPAAQDSLEYSVMTYHSYVPSPGRALPEDGYTNETYGYPQTYMMYDIAALQSLYGADFGFRNSNTVYKWSPTTGETFVNGIGQGAPGNGAGGSANRIFLTLWDGGGVDTYDFSNYKTKVAINLSPGSYSAIGDATQRAELGDGHHARGNVFNALQSDGDPRSLIENAKGGSGSDTIVGNAAANALYGNAGKDVLDGRDGRDVLVGGSGADAFVFKLAPSRASMDRILDFSVTDDTIRLENAAFTALTKTGWLARSAFQIGSAAHDRSDRIIYDKASGGLAYDADGTGAVAAIQFAKLKAGLALTASDFLVI